MHWKHCLIILSWIGLLAGCQLGHPQLEYNETPQPERSQQSASTAATPASSLEQPRDLQPVAYLEETTDKVEPEEIPLGKIKLEEVVISVHQSFPLVEAAFLENEVVNGKHLASWGEFDTKIKAASESGPLGFYKTYRNSAGVLQPLYQGGEVFSGYRVGRGSFQPWYLERQTNDGGEFKAGVRVPLLRGKDIDERRADMWRATYDQQIAQPEIRAQLIGFVNQASFAYWKWIAAGLQVKIGEDALELATKRNEKLSIRVEKGDLDPPSLKDNQRSIALREAKLLDRQRKLDQAAIKLSLYYRSADGMPVIPDESSLTTFPDPFNFSEAEMEEDLQLALVQRPELESLDARLRKVNVDLAEANNLALPGVDVQLVGSQDVGAPSSSKRDKSPFELEAGVFVDVPLQRRKALGKSQAAAAKMRQISIKRRFTEDKISAEVRASYTAVAAAYQRVQKSTQARELAEYMADVERRKFELGQTNLLNVFLREQNAIESADVEVDSLLDFFLALANYEAALAFDWPQRLKNNQD